MIPSVHSAALTFATSLASSACAYAARDADPERLVMGGFFMAFLFGALAMFSHE